MADYGGELAIDIEQALLRVACVAAEELVSAIAREHDVDARVPCLLRAPVRWNYRRVAERLVAGSGDARNAGRDVVWRHVVLVMLGVEMARGDPGVRHF